ncbi:MAG TPA: hypothetical protein VE959_34205 [Bryobacteraceae bacterium]|nr:hypothetical protein [Bryobacteraceae bacterium]
MLNINRRKCFNYYLPTGITAILLMAAGIGYLVFITHAGGGTSGNGTHGFFVQQGGKFMQRGGKVVIGGKTGGGGAGKGPVNFESACPAGTVTGGTAVSCTIVLGGANSTRAVLVGLAMNANTATGISCTVGGATAALIPGTDSGTTENSRTLLFGLSTSLTGSQTVTCSWASDTDAVLGAISATGVNQATPFNNGTFSGVELDAPCSVTVTSSNGDLSSSVLGTKDYDTTRMTNQTLEWTGNVNSDNNVGGNGDIDPGTGTATHNWNNGSFFTYATCSGANFQAHP